jgi:hypothetical protein
MGELADYLFCPCEHSTSIPTHFTPVNARGMIKECSGSAREHSAASPAGAKIIICNFPESIKVRQLQCKEEVRPFKRARDDWTCPKCDFLNFARFVGVPSPDSNKPLKTVCTSSPNPLFSKGKLPSVKACTSLQLFFGLLPGLTHL